MTTNTKQDRIIYLILNILSWVLVFAVFFAKNLFMVFGDFVLVILIDIRLATLRKRIKSKNNQHNQK